MREIENKISKIKFIFMVIIIPALSFISSTAREITLKIENPSDEAIYIQTCTWEIHFLEESKSLFAYPDTSYKINHIVFYQNDRGLKAKTHKYDLFDDKILKFKKLMPGKEIILMINISDSIDLTNLDKTGISVPYATAYELERYFRNEKLNITDFTIDRDTISIDYKFRSHINILYGDCPKSDIKGIDIESLKGLFDERIVE